MRRRGPTTGASEPPVGLSWPVVAIGEAVGGGVAPQLPSRLGSSRFPRPGSAPGADLAAVVAGSAPVFVPTELLAAPRERDLDNADVDSPDVAAMGEGGRGRGLPAGRSRRQHPGRLPGRLGPVHQVVRPPRSIPLPAAPAVVAAYLAEAANTTAASGRSVPWRYSPATLARRLATITKRTISPASSPGARSRGHRDAGGDPPLPGHPSEAEDPAVRPVRLAALAVGT